jgi:hypothetical protein
MSSSSSEAGNKAQGKGDSTGRRIELYGRSFAHGYDKRKVEEGSRTLRVLQWNLLADGLSGRHPDKGGFSSPAACLEWECRRAGILAEVRLMSLWLGCYVHYSIIYI